MGLANKALLIMSLIIVALSLRSENSFNINYGIIEHRVFAET
jgi:hypothetical protein